MHSCSFTLSMDWLVVVVADEAKKETTIQYPFTLSKNQFRIDVSKLFKSKGLKL